MLRRDLADGVLTLTMDWPERRNALGYAEVAELLGALRGADRDDAVRCVVLTAEGTTFSAGGDLREFQREVGGSAYDLWRTGEDWEELFRLIPRLGVPVLSAVNGAALAGACGVVALSDIALAASSATFGLSEIRIGLFPIVVLPAVRRVVGERIAREMALTGRRIDAEEARRVGLVNRVVDDAELAAETRALAADIAGLGRVPLALGKRLLADTGELPYEDALNHARAMRGAFLHTEELAEGIAAFLEKRTPRW